MTIDLRTVAELEAAGFTHVDARCASCSHIVQMPFLKLRLEKKIDDRTTMAELRRRYVCSGCGSKQAKSFTPWVQGGLPDGGLRGRGKGAAG